MARGEHPSQRLTASRASIRRMLAKMLPTDPQLEEFCGDSFPEVAHQFGSNMERRRKESLLLDAVDGSVILDHLIKYSSETFARHRHLLEPAVVVPPRRLYLGLSLVCLVVLIAGVLVALPESDRSPVPRAIVVPDSTPSPWPSSFRLSPVDRTLEASAPDATHKPAKSQQPPPQPPSPPRLSITVRTRPQEQLMLCPRDLPCERPIRVTPRKNGDVIEAEFTQLPPGHYVVTCSLFDRSKRVEVTLNKESLHNVHCFNPI